ncbi:kinetochore protein NDC80 homolog [Penaeus japonicus]|uniref:kinetochore protein NDC80 homolog n=1 Tax=Penaeus japonicus TaxID=27405 RepID=UPI001C71771F|nr:kinetochore protein NDC80 homolog [Penaeus japonicus]
MSVGSALKSATKNKVRSEVRPVTDPSFKSLCVDNVLEFLMMNGYENQVQRRTLLGPTVKDFTSFFEFIYCNLDAAYSLPTRFEEEIPRLLKLLKYPVQIPKSSFTTVSSPHTWPSVLAMLSWLVDVVNMYQIIDPMTITFPDDFDPDIRLAKTKFITLVNLLKNEGDEERLASILREYEKSLEDIKDVTAETMMKLEEEDQHLRDKVKQLASSRENLQLLDHHHTQLTEDCRKLRNYCKELEVHVTAKSSERSQLEKKLEEVSGMKAKVFEEVQNLESLHSQQAFSNEELSRYKNHANEIAAKISYCQAQGSDLDSQIWNLEMDTGKAQRKLSEGVGDYNNLARSLELPKEYEIDLINLRESVGFWKTDLLNTLRAKKKEVRQATYKIENRIMNQDEENCMIQEILQDKKNELAKLQKKIQFIDEDTQITKNDNVAEERELLQILDRFQQQITEFFKTSNVSVHKKESEMKQLAEELMILKEQLKDRKRLGMEFLVRVSQAAIKHVEWEQERALRYQNNVETICADLIKEL